MNECYPAEYQALLEWLRPQLIPWRKMIIAIDGVDHAGKSSLARFLAWQCEMPAIETDFTLTKGIKSSWGSCIPAPVHDTSLLKTLIEHRHKLNRPVLVEGVFVLQQLEAINFEPDLLIEIQAIGVKGTWEKKFAEYRLKHPRSASPDFVVIRGNFDAQVKQ